jgi:cytochrome c2
LNTYCSCHLRYPLVGPLASRSGEHIGAISDAGADDDLGALRDMRGAEVFKACAVCHTLRPDGAGRAGPTLFGLFGRKAGTVPGYSYSEAFRNLDLVWTEETVSRLFEIGPQAYTPGTKMPEQTVGNAQERRAPIEFLKAATDPKQSDRTVATVLLRWRSGGSSCYKNRHIPRRAGRHESVSSRRCIRHRGCRRRTLPVAGYAEGFVRRLHDRRRAYRRSGQQPDRQELTAPN